MLSKEQKDFITHCIQQNKELPEDFKYMLFPTIQKEYELTYAGKMRKEDILSNEDGVFPVPLQIEKIFNGNEYKSFDDEWRNMVIFGDNLQFLKTIYENKDPLIKDKIKGKVKLIYIDPPFATTDEFQNKDGAKAYNDKKKGAEFIEFLRRRLVLAREVLAEEGSIYIHLDNKMIHYVKLVMDEIFGKQNLVREIIWDRGNPSGGKAAAQNWIHTHDTILFYAKRKELKIFNKQYVPYTSEYIEQRFKHKDTKGRYRLQGSDSRKQYLKESKGKAITSVWSIADINVMALEKADYPTQKPEALLRRIIEASTNVGDIVLDFFGGSGTTISVAEKLNRKWITCDLGKLSYFTIQKRILKVQHTKDLLAGSREKRNYNKCDKCGNNKVLCSVDYVEKNKKYNQNAKTFMTCTLGIYDLKKTLDLEWEKYCNFVSGLFELNLHNHKISGYAFEGKKTSYSVKIWDYNKFKESNIDESYLNSIHQSIGSKATGRIYIVAPANHIDFLTDYHEIDGLRYYFLKIPYQVIRDLHKIPFQKLRQPQSKKNVNDLDETIGFHFIKQPEVKTQIKKSLDEINISIKEFKSQYYKDENGKVLENFETLSAVFIDSCFNGEQFIMTHSFFADDLLPKRKTKSEDNEEIRNELVQLKNKVLNISIKKSETGKKIMAVYTDIYGNDFTEVFNI